MLAPAQTSLAEKFIVEDLKGARQQGSRLHGILMRMDAELPLSELARSHLLAVGLNALHALAVGEIDGDAFEHAARTEQVRRVEAAKVAAIEKAAEEERRKVEQAAASAAIFSDPAFQRRQEGRQLRRRYDVGSIEPRHYARVMQSLRTLANGGRLKAEDAVWLQTRSADYWSDAVATAWHLSEAEALTDAWRARGDPWDAINASSHWRKGGRPAEAIAITEEAMVPGRNYTPRVRSALATTRGAALRASRRLTEAKAIGEEAHGLLPGDFRPCTLLGAVCIELGDLSAGHAWYVRAEARGASKTAIDDDIKALLRRMPKIEQEYARRYLGRQDPERFAWLTRSGRGDPYFGT